MTKSPSASGASQRTRQRSGKRPSDVSDLVYVADSDIHGKGMFAAVDIKKNTLIGELVGTPTREDGIYVLWITKKLGLTLKNDLKYINHGKKPNCELSDVDVVTTRAIKKDEELLHDYGW